MNDSYRSLPTAEDLFCGERDCIILVFVRSNIGFHTCKSSRRNATMKIGQTLPLERLLFDIVFKVFSGTL